MRVAHFFRFSILLIALQLSGLTLPELAAQEPAGPTNTRPAPPFDPRQPPLHDPSNIIRAGDRYYLFHTGRGVGSLSSPDLIHWERGPAVWSEFPHWVREVVPDHRGHFWAPDIIELQGRYLLYYSVSAFGKQTSAIGLAVNQTLDPADPRYQWTDRGIVVQTNADSDHNAIDPSLLLTSQGELWMAYGSFWSGLKLVQLDPATGLLLDPAAPPISLAWAEQIEAPTLHERDGWFYLFINWGWCCRGLNSTYNIRVGRSRQITGPYLDREGRDLRQAGGTLVLDSEGHELGPGHAGLISQGDRILLSYHFYDARANGLSRLGFRNLRWSADGWPEVLPRQQSEPAPQPTPAQP